MSIPKGKSLQLQSYPVQVHSINGIKLPKLHKRKKRNLHTKNPYVVKTHIIPDDSNMKPKKLNGFLLLAITKNDMPHEIFRANLSRLKIVECSEEDQKYFINLAELDVSENNLMLEQLIHFPVLKKLRICANNIQQINMSSECTFSQLKCLDLAFNYLEINAIQSLTNIPNLIELSLSNNELVELPEQMDTFQVLQKLDVSDNNFSSNFNAHSLWFTLSSIPNLINLNISKNYLRGIHTEKLVAGNFAKLEVLDISYNQVENQHNLICARNFKKLKEIIVTGNPFAILKELQGIEMEIHARTGGKLVNEDVPRAYLRKKKQVGKPPIRFEQIRRVEDVKLKWVEKEQSEVDQEPEDLPQDAEQVLFMTENPVKLRNNRVSQMEKSGSVDGGRVNQSKHTYDEFKKLAFEILGDRKDYDAPNVDLKTAYKNLRQLMNRPEGTDYKNFEEPHYLKPTASIQRYKFNQEKDDSQSISLVNIPNGTNEKRRNSQLSYEVQ